MVKPIALDVLASLFCWLALAHRNDKQHAYRQIASAVGGAAVAFIAAFLFLVHWHAVHAFWVVMTHLIPLHAEIGPRSWRWLLLHSVSSVMLPIFLIWIPVCIARRSWNNPETAILLFGFLFGVLSFCLQGRGYPYHRYPSESFLLMLIGMDLSAALSSKGKVMNGLACAAITFATIVTAPSSMPKSAASTGRVMCLMIHCKTFSHKWDKNTSTIMFSVLTWQAAASIPFCEEGSYKAQDNCTTATSSILLIPPVRKKTRVGTGVASWQRW